MYTIYIYKYKNILYIMIENKIHVQKTKNKKIIKIQKTHSSTLYKCSLRRMQQIGVLLMF